VVCFCELFWQSISSACSVVLWRIFRPAPHPRFETFKLLQSKVVGICILQKLQGHELITWFFFYVCRLNSWNKELVAIHWGFV
jgi:hypothetical protein